MGSETAARARRYPLKPLAWLIAVAAGSFAFMPICDLHFDCGCGWPGLGAGHAHCDILQAGPPDCPWCYHTWLGYAVMGLSATLSGLGLVWAPSTWRLAPLLAAAIGVMVAGLVLTGLATSLWLGLPLLAGV